MQAMRHADTANIFGPAVPTKRWGGTATANGRHVPDAWFNKFVEYFDGKTGVDEVTIVVENSGQQKHRHLHFHLLGSITTDHLKDLKKILKKLFNIGTGESEIAGKLQIKPADAGWLKYMAKDENKHGWKQFNNHGVDAAEWKRLRIE